MVGGGDTAMEDATFLSKFAGKVSVVHRRPEFRASAIMLERARQTENIDLRHALRGARASSPARTARSSTAVLENTEDGVHEGDRRSPAPSWRSATSPTRISSRASSSSTTRATCSSRGAPRSTKLPGVFAAGDLTDRVYRQAVTAAGTGCMAALDAEAYLRDTPIDPEAHWAPDPDRVEAAAESEASAHRPVRVPGTWTQLGAPAAVRARANRDGPRSEDGARRRRGAARTRVKVAGVGPLVHRHRLHRRRDGRPARR